jgi:hypothetical protein
MEPPDPGVDATVQSQGIDIRKKRIEEMLAEVLAVLGVERPTSIKVLDCGLKYPQPHHLLSELELRVVPIHWKLCARVVPLLRVLQGLFVPGGDSYRSPSRAMDSHSSSRVRSFSSQDICSMAGVVIAG